MAHVRPPQFARHLDGEADDGRIILAAPHIGRFQASVEAGQLIEGGQHIGTLHILHHRVAILAPQGTTGRVMGPRPQRVRPVGFGEALLTLEPVDALGAHALGARGVEDALDDDEFVVRVPTDGLFYRASSPEEPPFASPGDTLAPGDTIGLIEVMKFFYPIPFEGNTPCEVVRFLIEDATPVEGGAALLVCKRS